MFYDAWMVLEGYVECLLGLTGFNGLWPCEVSTGLWFLSLGLTGFEWLGLVSGTGLSFFGSLGFQAGWVVVNLWLFTGFLVLCWFEDWDLQGLQVVALCE